MVWLSHSDERWTSADVSTREKKIDVIESEYLPVEEVEAVPNHDVIDWRSYLPVHPHSSIERDEERRKCLRVKIDKSGSTSTKERRKKQIKLLSTYWLKKSSWSRSGLKKGIAQFATKIVTHRNEQWEGSLMARSCITTSHSVVDDHVRRRNDSSDGCIARGLTTNAQMKRTRRENVEGKQNARGSRTIARRRNRGREKNERKKKTSTA